jgi:hypothetical protein
MTRRIIVWCSFMAVAAIGGCASEPTAPANPAPQATPTESTPTAAPAPQPVREPTADELPVPEDYEAEARAQITAKNLSVELDALEKAIGAQ